MSSLARRTVRTTAAAAGIAALGAGLAGNAVAAPTADVDAPAPEAASALQGLPSAVPLTELPSAPAVPNLADLPMLFVFQGPTVKTAGPASTPVPSTTQLPDAAGRLGQRGAPRVGLRRGPAGGRPPTPSTPAQVGALSALDSAGLFGGLAQERLVDQEGFDMSTDRVGGLG